MNDPQCIIQSEENRAHIGLGTDSNIPRNALTDQNVASIPKNKIKWVKKNHPPQHRQRKKHTKSSKIIGFIYFTEAQRVWKATKYMCVCVCAVHTNVTDSYINVYIFLECLLECCYRLSYYITAAIAVVIIFLDCMQKVFTFSLVKFIYRFPL